MKTSSNIFNLNSRMRSSKVRNAKSDINLTNNFRQGFGDREGYLWHASEDEGKSHGPGETRYPPKCTNLPTTYCNLRILYSSRTVRPVEWTISNTSWRKWQNWMGFRCSINSPYPIRSLNNHHNLHSHSHIQINRWHTSNF